MGFLEFQNVPEVSFGTNMLGPYVRAAILFWRHPYICSTTVLHDIYYDSVLVVQSCLCIIIIPCVEGAR